MKTDLKKLTLNQETLRDLTNPSDKAKAEPNLLFTVGLNCLETNCICCWKKL